ncbi:zinc-finger protein [Coemansia sp. RSA 988]|nr:zinc-finger protein [Coemansia sp. RSA 988]
MFDGLSRRPRGGSVGGGIQSNSGASEYATLPPLHEHRVGQASEECESAGCGRPLTLPSLSALGIVDTAPPASGRLVDGVAASRQRSGMTDGMKYSSVSTAADAAKYSNASTAADGSGRSDDLEQQCLWSTCTQIFGSIDELVRHLYKLHVATNRTGGGRSSTGDLAKQELRVLTAGFFCRWASCGTRAQDTEELINHVCQDHLDAGQIRHRCGWTDCGQSHGSIDALTEHLSATHIGSGRSSYTCAWEGCERGGKPFTQRQRALRHIQTHTGAKPFACRVCAKRFSEAHIMQQHLRVHTGERPFKCVQDGCGKEFAVSSALTIHRRTHTGERPYECRFDGCDRRFSESSNLTKHMRIHTGERPFKCPQSECGKTFSRPDQVSRHQRMHSARRPLACPVDHCPKTFSTPTTRLSHLRSLHPDAASATVAEPSDLAHKLPRTSPP